MEYTNCEIVAAVIIMAIVIAVIFFLISLLPDHMIDPLDKKEHFEKNKGEKHDSRSDL